MINLLPPEEKRQIRAARNNSLLFRYNIFTVGALLFLLAAIAVTFLFLTSVKSRAEQTIADSQTRVVQYQDVKTEADTFKSNLATAKQILDKETTYTNAILQISRALPKGVILQQLDLDASTFGTPTTLSLQVKSHAVALKLKDALQASPVFEDVHFRNITAGQEGDYPYSVTMGVTIKKEVATQ